MSSKKNSDFFNPIDRAIEHMQNYIQEVAALGSNLISILKLILENKEKFSEVAVEKIQNEFSEIDRLLTSQLIPTLEYSREHTDSKYGGIINDLKSNLDKIFTTIEENNSKKFQTEKKSYINLESEEENYIKIDHLDKSLMRKIEILSETDEESLKFFNSKVEERDSETSKCYTIELIEPSDEVIHESIQVDRTDIELSHQMRKKMYNSSLKKLEYSYSDMNATEIQEMNSFTVEDLETPDNLSPTKKENMNSPLGRICLKNEPEIEVFNHPSGIYTVNTLFNFNSKQNKKLKW